MAPVKRFEMNLTEGPILPKVLRYALPLMASGVLQLLFNAADMVVVGQFAGENSDAALAAVGSTGSLINLLVNLFIGLSVGGSVAVAKAYGAADRQAIHNAVHTAITIAALAGLLVGVGGFIFCRPLLQLMDNPELELATLYMKIYFLGMPFNMVYNFGASILGAVGDTKRPLAYLTIAGVVNVVLNLVMVVIFKLSVSGVAIATVASQIVSAVLVVQCLVRSDTAIHLDVKALRIYPRQMKEIVQVGLPAGLQSSLFSVSNVLIQSSINSFGSLAVAGNSAAASLEGFAYTCMNALRQAAQTFAGQNLGARKIQRVRRSMWICLAAITVIGIVVGGLFLLLGEPLLGLYNDKQEVIAYGMIRLTWMLPFYCLCGLMDCITGTLRGIGYAIMPMVVTLTGACLFRVAWILTVFAMPEYHTLEVLYLSYPLSWGLTFAVHLVCYALVAQPKLSRLEQRTAWEA